MKQNFTFGQYQPLINTLIAPWEIDANLKQAQDWITNIKLRASKGESSSVYLIPGTFKSHGWKYQLLGK